MILDVIPLLLVACAAAPPSGDTTPTAGCAALERWAPDADGDGFGDDAGVLLTCEPPAGYIQVEGDCDDTNPAVHTGAPDVCADGIDADCDGLDPADRGARPLGAADAAWTAAGSEDGALFGWAVAAMPGPEGYPEVLLGAPGDDNLAGALWVAGGVVLGEVHALRPPTSTRGDRFGAALAVADLSGDGLPDAVVSAPAGADGAGAVWLLEGPGDTVEEVVAGAPASFLGVALAAGGDATGDGVPDLLASAVFGTEASGSYTSGAWLVPGPLPAGGSVEADGIAVASAAADDAGGAAVDFVDADGDGVDEVALGAPATERDGVVLGAVWIVTPGTPADAGPASFAGTVADGDFGAVVATLGDYTGDGYDDLAIGAPSQDAVPDELRGEATVWPGPLAGPHLADDAPMRVSGTETYSLVGSHLAGIDLTGDALPDLVVTGLAATVSDDAPLSGAVYAYTCGRLGRLAPEDAALTWYGSGTLGYFGHGLAATTDHDGDDIGDLVVGAPLAENDHSIYPGAAWLMVRPDIDR